ncbi:MAG: SusE domain-containing protein [Lutibacter sp.]|nr:SusE domain-containing protein [Lutibacter sp.]
MKIILNKILLLIVAATFLASCDKEELTVLNPNAETTVSLSVSNVVLDKDNAGQDVLTVSWTDPDYGFDAAAGYKIVFTAGEKSVTVAAGTNLSKVFETVQLNKILLNLGLKGGTPAQVSVQIEAVLSVYHSLSSNSTSFMATAYEDKLDLSTIWGVVGSATVNGWNGPDMPFYTTSIADVFVAYVTLSNGHIKFRSNNSWALNYGDTGLDGKLDEGGTDIPVTAGTYKITFNLSALTYTIEAYTWGLVGDATTNGWDGPDMPMAYDSFSDTWKAIVTLKAGKVKFRFNNNWGLNYGDTGADGKLDNNGADIAVTAGNYLVVFDLKNLVYTITPINIWGLVGDAAPNGWDGPNVRFTLDFSKDDVWVINRVTLTTGKIKFRTNDSWDLNYGDNGLDGTLEVGGADIPVAAGTYKIVLDFSNSSAPKYTLTAL